ncbi:MAG: hypothetical protein NDI80_09945 [Flavobacteriaceae bacterium]|nr:hypothetical protein [Flavobacteriaceae bacterium]
MKNIVGLLIAILILLTSCGTTTGTVKGTLCYPSDYIPAMNVYLKNNENGKTYSLLIKENQQTFKFKKILEGKYSAYAYTISEINTDFNNQTSKASGGYTQAVPCGLTVNCNNHSLINFNVKKGKTTKAIQICDWYGAMVPKE